MSKTNKEIREKNHDLNGEELDFIFEQNNRYEMLETETQDRLERYRVYNSFFNGDQWFRVKNRKTSGRHQHTINLIAPTIKKLSALLMGEPPRITVPRESELTPLFDIPVLADKVKREEIQKNIEAGLPEEFNRSEAIEKILRRVMYDDNNFDVDLKLGARNGSKYGDTVFYVFYDKDQKKVVIENIFPGHVRLGFSSNDYRKIEYGFTEKVMTVSEIKRKYKPEFEVEEEEVDETTWNATQFYHVPSAKVKYYWDDKVYAVIVNDKVVFKQNHEYGRVPLFLIPNDINPEEPWGVSDAIDVLTIQEDYNMSVSDEADIVKIYADPKILVFNPGKTKLKHFQASGAKVIPVAKDASVQPFQFTGNIFPTQSRVQRIKNDYHMVSGLPEIAFGSAQGSIVTGVALTAQFAPTLQIIRDKITVWNSSLQDIAGFILDLLEKFGGNEPTTKVPYKTIIDGWRRVDWIWGTKMPRDDSIFMQNEISKMNARIQSRTRTMTNLGVPSPQDELELIAFEETNPILSPKFEMERQAAEVATGAGGEPEMLQRAESENQRMAAGEAVQVFGRNIKEHQMHLEVHSMFVKNNPDLEENILDLFDQHMQGHEIAIAGGGKQGGVRPNSGRPSAPQAPTVTEDTAQEPAPVAPQEA